MILQVAGLLHDAGAFIGANGHHKHSMYLIANSDIFGIGSLDTRIAACVARYHRRALPATAHPEYASLDREDRILVSKLAAILRVADALDRGHAQRCRNIEIELDPGMMTITVRGGGNITVEQYGMSEKGEMFERVYGRKVVLRSA
jgi:exopolyphosphatase/guanosine-5'-triphosphate,3'-diphosphate pyrophosphatase